jgi:ankyrin repeat protein
MRRFILTTGILLGLAAASAPILPSLSAVEGQTQSAPPRSAPSTPLATVIQEGRRTEALAMIKAGADVNAAQADGTRPIHWAVYRVDHELVDALIAKKARVDVANEFGHTPLAEAVRQADARIVKALLSAGSGTEGANEDGQTALMIAIKNAELPVFQMLLDAGAQVNVVEKVQGQTPLMWAAAAPRNAGEMVKALIAKGANVNARARFTDWPSQITSEPRAQYHAYGGLTPLLYAARGGCYTCVEALIAAGADVNLPTPEGVSPIMVALDNDHNGVARLLMERGGNPHVWDVYGRTALYIAVGNTGGGAAGGAAPGRGGPGGGAPGAGGRGAAPGAGAAAPGAGRGAPGAPAPGAGAAPGGQGRVGQGVAQGAAPGARAGGQAGQGQGQGGRAGGGGGRAGAGGGGRGPAGGAASADSGPQVSPMEMLTLLLAAGVDVNPQLNMRRPSNQGGRFSDPLLSTGTTPLLHALIINANDVVRLLLEKGANPNIYGMGLSPWLYAAGITSGTYNEGRGGGGGNVDTTLLDLMLQHGADINGQVTGAASYSGRIARALTGDPINTKSNEGMTALHVAVRSRNASLVQYLIGKGARTDIKDASGRTPLDVLDGVPAYQPAVFADADGVVPPNPNATPAAPATAPPAGAGRAGGAGGAGGRGGGAGNPAAVEEIRGVLQKAPSQTR